MLGVYVPYTHLTGRFLRTEEKGGVSRDSGEAEPDGIGLHNMGDKSAYGKLSTTSTKFSTVKPAEASTILLDMEIKGKPVIEVLSYAKAPVYLT